MKDDLHEPHPASTCDAFPLAVALSQAKAEIESLQRQLAEAVANEREECLNECSRAGRSNSPSNEFARGYHAATDDIAAAIRDRSNG